MRQQGFTLIELMAVCIIISVIFFSGSSSYAFFLEKAQTHTDKTKLLSMIRMARQQSINSSTTSVLCPTIDQETCIRDWKLPVMLFNDLNKNKKRDRNEVITAQFGPFNRQGVQINYPKSQIRFDPQGMTNYYNGTLSYCFKNLIEAIVISRIGRVRYALDLDGDHIPDVNSSTPVSCQ